MDGAPKMDGASGRNGSSRPDGAPGMNGSPGPDGALGRDTATEWTSPQQTRSAVKCRRERRKVTVAVSPGFEADDTRRIYRRCAEGVPPQLPFPLPLQKTARRFRVRSVSSEIESAPSTRAPFYSDSLSTSPSTGERARVRTERHRVKNTRHTAPENFHNLQKFRNG